MMVSRVRVSLIFGLGLAVAAAAGAQVQPPAPTPDEVVRRACDAAGGLEAYKKLGIVGIAAKSEEVTQEGTISAKLRNTYFLSPGPVPGRFEYPEAKIFAGDAGDGGWAVVADKADKRLSTSYIVKRSLTTLLFPTLMPFSLTWDGVSVQDVTAAQLKGTQVWKLTVNFPRSFFDSPQIASTWTVFVDAATYAVVRAESPFTDLGKGVTADGMRFTWREPVKLKGVTFYKEQRLTGLDETGLEKSHSRVDRFQYHLIPASESGRLFGNPIPPDQRPKPPALQPPQLPPAGSNG